jgi:type II secretory pathway component PulF
VLYLAPRIESIAPLSLGWVRLMLGDAFQRAYERWRTLTLARSWVAGGQAPLEALRHAARTLRIRDDVAAELHSTVSLAAELEAADSELEHLFRESVEKFRFALELRRAVVIRFLQVTTAALVGVIVLALYLPIFKMGAIV